MIDNTKVTVHATFKDAQLNIYAIVDLPDEVQYLKLYNKIINMWVHQEILAEDVFAKYEGVLRKCEEKLPRLIEQIKLKKCI